MRSACLALTRLRWHSASCGRLTFALHLTRPVLSLWSSFVQVQRTKRCSRQSTSFDRANAPPQHDRNDVSQSTAGRTAKRQPTIVETVHQSKQTWRTVILILRPAQCRRPWRSSRRTLSPDAPPRTCATHSAPATRSPPAANKHTILHRPGCAPQQPRHHKHARWNTSAPAQREASLSKRAPQLGFSAAYPHVCPSSRVSA